MRKEEKSYPHRLAGVRRRDLILRKAYRIANYYSICLVSLTISNEYPSGTFGIA